MALRRQCASPNGFSLSELLVGVMILGILASLGWQGGREAWARQRLEAATRRLDQGIQRGRAEALRMGQACGLSLQAKGWMPPQIEALPACQHTLASWSEPIDPAEIQLQHNFPNTLRFSSNGLVLDGGTAVLSASGTTLQRCLVMSLPLGITRVGRYRNGGCGPDPSL